MKHTATELKQKQSLPLEAKIIMTKARIQQWIEHWDSDVYVAFSGGLDSTVLLDIVWSIDPTIPAVFSNTGLEFPEIKTFVKSFGDKVTWIKPKMSFRDVIDKYGYPILSKKVSMGISRYRNTKSEEQKSLRLHGGINPTSGRDQQRTIPKKYHYLVDAPFKISDRCCDILKKNPFKLYEKETGNKPIIGTMASDSDLRRVKYFQQGCNSFNSNQSAPLSFWLKSDILEYVEIKDLQISEIYSKGYDRTGCIFCMFGCHMEKESRFLRLKTTNPKQYDFCLKTLGLGKVLDAIKVRY